jgi:inosine-uridine nucleoside N-ribohydrolase
MPVFIGDPGVDDAIALGVLASQGAPLPLVVATGGNVDVDAAAVVAAGVAATLGLDVPVQAARTLGLTVRPPAEGEEEPPHGADGFGGHAGALPTGRPAADFTPAALRGADVFASGPLSAVAAALEDSAVPRRVLWMGGAICGGSFTAAAEFNAWCDPVAADRVLSSGVPVDVVPLEATTPVRLDQGDLRRWAGASPSARVLAAAAGARLARGAAVPHDAVAAVAWLAPELFEWEARTVRCEPAGRHTRGALVVDRRGPPGGTSTRVAVDVDAAAVRRLIVDSIAALP